MLHKGNFSKNAEWIILLRYCTKEIAGNRKTEIVSKGATKGIVEKSQNDVFGFEVNCKAKYKEMLRILRKIQSKIQRKY